MLYVGAYVGEVIRHETNDHYRWIDYNDYMPAHPDLQPMLPERTVAACAFLVDDGDAMSMPLNRSPASSKMAKRTASTSSPSPTIARGKEP